MSVRRTRMSRDLSRLLLIFLLVLRGSLSKEIQTPQFLRRVYEVIHVNSTAPYCFTTTGSELVCFWQSSEKENSSYTFEYQSQDQPRKSCALTTEADPEDTWWYICNFPALDVFSFEPINITLTRHHHDELTLYQKVFYTNDLVFLEPPRNVTVTEKTFGGYLVSWEPPSMSFEDSIKFEVKYSSSEEDTHTESVDKGLSVLLMDLKALTQYTVYVRARLDGISYSGYWSEWTPPVIIETSIDPLQIMLYVFGSLLLVTIPLLLILKYISVIKHKVWPQIPTPDSHFRDLYTIHKGNFKLWLGQADFYRVWTSRHTFYDDPYSALEILSELSSTVTSPRSSVQLPAKDNYVILNEKIVPHLSARVAMGRHQTAWMEPQRRNFNHFNDQFEEHGPEETSKREARLVAYDSLETQSTELSQEEPGFEEAPILKIGHGESYGHENDFLEAPQIEDDWQNSDVNHLRSKEGKHSPASSFEYTVVETCEGLLSPKPRPPRPPCPPCPPPPSSLSLKYAYLLMSGSGEESRPPSPNIYQNDHLLHQVYSQC
ncbi:erythropoietin receptor [Spea bombifrons]|uniref:erythropoietin receptor n=1 Tax=Spea bombifrons TaxID=233779 RepID=UPI00234A7B5D|nr:erythropoietin receptor [Spea bombifrons]